MQPVVPGELGALDAAVAPLCADVVLHSPVAFTSYRGPGAVAPILRAVSEVFEDFHYVREIGAGDAADHALVFQARIGDVRIEGCDILHVDEHGAIDDLTVMVRPLPATLVLAKAMEVRLAAARRGRS